MPKINLREYIESGNPISFRGEMTLYHGDQEIGKIVNGFISTDYGLRSHNIKSISIDYIHGGLLALDPDDFDNYLIEV
ncbi:MAG: hypothetical protein KKB03_00340 [Nanoarchaeota archaeon]|nr:hypothetical protein [Nanoarchaeota archaeon]MBU1135435.1 hypothetical protein [Nanoarchaeota archaeon]MBU2519677.1 hypothetical protein [Nanoarchaeota archaeon]